MSPAPKHLVLATAGHIDHGKTELTRALTGINTDRLKEEQERGITIDLGFAHVQLGEDRRLSVIDVPGHERFVKNMLAGVHGVDLALLVVAADESVMPQTREHLDILKLLGVRRGLVALTKRDLVDAETLELAQLEVAEFVAGSFLEDAPLLAVSARTGEGIEELRAELVAAFDAVPARGTQGPFRLHLDRAFSVRGFGAVITGTVVSGRIAEGDELDVLPDGPRARVRGLEVHGVKVAEAQSGRRAALNLSGVELSQLRRGQQLLAPAGCYRASSLLDVELELLESAPRLKDLARVRFHLGAEEALARVKLLGVEQLEPGATALAQLRLERPVLAWPQDRFIVRRYGPITTIGGGRVLDNLPLKHRGRAAGAAEALALLAEAGLAERLVLHAAERRRGGLGFDELVARSGTLPEQVRDALEQAVAAGGLVSTGGTRPLVASPRLWQLLRERALAELAAYHKREPLRPGLSREELKERLLALGREPQLVRAVLEELEREGALRLEAEVAALAAHRVSLGSEGERIKQELAELYRQQGLNPPTAKELAERWPRHQELVAELLKLLEREGQLLPIGGGLSLHASAWQRLRELLEPWAESGEPLGVPRFKQLTGTSRKHAIPLLEYLDRQHITRRQGDARVVVGLKRS